MIDKENNLEINKIQNDYIMLQDKLVHEQEENAKLREIVDGITAERLKNIIYKSKCNGCHECIEKIVEELR